MRYAVAILYLAMWLVFLLMLYDFAGFYAAALSAIGTMFYTGFCLLIKGKEEDDG